MYRSTASTGRRASGQAAIFVTLSLVPTLGLLGLVVDVGWGYWRREASKTAADSAVMAAAMAASSASSLTCGSGVTCQTDTACPAAPTSPPANNLMAGCLYAKQNGFTSSGRQTVTMAANTTASPVAGVSPAYWITATVSETIPTGFSAILGQMGMTVSAKSVAGVFKSGGGCVYILSPTGTSVSGSGTVSLQSGCGVYVDSSSSSAVTLSGSASITTEDGANTNIAGNWSHSGSATISPAPITGAPVAPDPFASMPPPSVGSCTSTGESLSGSATYTFNSTNNVICGAVSLSGSSSVTFQPGIYVLKDGLSLSGLSSMTGTGVMLYLSGGSINISGGTTVNMSAPTSGTYQGILIYQSRSDSSASSLSGGSGEIMNGVLYFPDAGLSYSGGSSTDATTTTIVCNTLTMSGASYISAAASTPYTGSVSGAYFLQ